jgi:ribonuclease Z
MSTLEAFVLGCGGMMPLPGRRLTSVLLRRDGELFLFDCGEGTQVGLRALNLSWKKISAVFISHTHADHITGLPGLLMLSSQADREEPLYIYGPPPVREFVEQSRRLLDMYINYDIIIKEVKEAATIVDDPEFRIRCFPLRHTKPCFGYTLEEYDRPGEFFPEKAAELGIPPGPLYGRLQHGEDITLDDGRVVESADVVGPPRNGRKVTFVTDTLALPAIADEAAGSDLFFCEGMFEKELFETAIEKRHMTSEQAALIAEAGNKNARIKKLALLHYSPRYAKNELPKLLAEAREIFPDTVLTRDGMAIEIPYSE